MKHLFLFLLLPFHLLAQDPIRNIKFPSRDKNGFTVGEITASPNGNTIMATFNGPNDEVAYDFVNVADGKVLSTGNLPSKPYSIIWNEDESLMAIKYRSGNPECFDTRHGLKKIFTCTADGEIVFTKNRSLLKKDPVLLYVFGDDMIHIYTSTGQLKDAVQLDDSEFYSYAWYDAVNDHFNLVKSTDDGIIVYSPKGTVLATNSISGPMLVSGREINKGGNYYLYYTDGEVYLYDPLNGKQTTVYKGTDISAATFTPDGKNIMIKQTAGFTMIDLQGKKINAIAQGGYYFKMMYATWGKELVCIDVDRADVFACKNYMPTIPERTEATETKPVVTKTVERPVPAISKPVQKTVAPKPAWTLPYIVKDFITPLQEDSFYLYTADKGVRYFIKYSKMESSILWANPYAYSQYFGLSNDSKYLTGGIYTLDMVDGNARYATYYKSKISGKDNEQMIGGQLFMAKIAPIAGQSISWSVKMYDDEYTLTSKVIDNIYKGKKAKCLVITRKDATADETYYYQQGIGLVKIESGGKVAAER